ncbi:hypothetical protein E0H70_28070 [Rhizobium leguminosarum bv. viciae]|nr:hypothetical protein E0H70_28070 [Rhizobium leguminosarum bv. viciae]
MNNQVVQRVAVIDALELNLFNPGVWKSTRLAASKHLQEIESAKLAFDIGSGTPAPDRAGAVILVLCRLYCAVVHQK